MVKEIPWVEYVKNETWAKISVDVNGKQQEVYRAVEPERKKEEVDKDLKDGVEKAYTNDRHGIEHAAAASDKESDQGDNAEDDTRVVARDLTLNIDSVATSSEKSVTLKPGEMAIILKKYKPAGPAKNAPISEKALNPYS